MRAPFLYATNGEVLWFHDVRHPRNCSRRVAGFHTPGALKEMLSRDFERACQDMKALPNDHQRLRPYQKQAIRHVMVENLSIDRDDFDDQATLADAGGWGAANKAFGRGKLDILMGRLNEAVAA